MRPPDLVSPVLVLSSSSSESESPSFPASIRHCTHNSQHITQLRAKFVQKCSRRDTIFIFFFLLSVLFFVLLFISPLVRAEPGSTWGASNFKQSAFMAHNFRTWTRTWTWTTTRTWTWHVHVADVGETKISWPQGVFGPSQHQYQQQKKKNTTVTALGKINERGFSVACNWGLSSVGYVFKIRLLPNLLETNLLA